MLLVIARASIPRGQFGVTVYIRGFTAVKAAQLTSLWFSEYLMVLILKYSAILGRPSVRGLSCNCNR